MAGNDRKLVILQDRDIHLLRELAIVRVVDREQAKIIAGFGSTTRANARLLALAKARYLRRFFWGTVGGARKALYILSQRGADLAGIPYRAPWRRENQILVADSHTAHQLAINEVYCTLKYRPVPNSPVRFLRWLSFQEPLKGTTLVPDGYVEVETLGRQLAFFFEIDLGNEGRVVWQRKVQAYLSYAASGEFATQFRQPQFKTLTVTTSEGRVKWLRVATAALTDKIFRVTTFERIKQTGFWADIWQKPTGSDQQKLF